MRIRTVICQEQINGANNAAQEVECSDPKPDDSQECVNTAGCGSEGQTPQYPTPPPPLSDKPSEEQQDNETGAIRKHF